MTTLPRVDLLQCYACGAHGLVVRGESTFVAWSGGHCGPRERGRLVEQRYPHDFPEKCPVCGDRPAHRDGF